MMYDAALFLRDALYIVSISLSLSLSRFPPTRSLFSSLLHLLAGALSPFSLTASSGTWKSRASDK